MSTNAQASTGLRNTMLAAYKTALDSGFINIYAGTVPASADDALGGATLLCVISNNSTSGGLTYATAPASGVLSKQASQVWSGVNVAGGTATFFRAVANSDSGTSTTSQPRIQGSVGTTDGGLNLTLGTTLTVGATTPIDSFSVELPTF